MPTEPMEEYSLYEPGKLVKCRSTLYSSPSDHDKASRISAGTIGLILGGPNPALGYPHDYQVQFLNNIVWWVGPHEIEPYLK